MKLDPKTRNRITNALTSSAPNLRDVLDIARELGCEVYIANGTGDVIVRLPGDPAPVRANCRRKDSPRHLTVRIRQYFKSLQESP